MYGSPLSKDWRRKKEEADKPLDKFKPHKCALSNKIGKELVGKTCSKEDLEWIERWLDNLVRSRSYPPQCAGKDAFNSLTKFLSTKAVLDVLELLRKEFLLAHPCHVPPLDDFGFLLELEASL